MLVFVSHYLNYFSMLLSLNQDEHGLSSLIQLFFFKLLNISYFFYDAQVFIIFFFLIPRVVL